MIVIDLNEYRLKLLNKTKRPSLFVSHLTGKVTGATNMEFETNITKIKESIIKINKLMQDIKDMSSEADKLDDDY